jgi:HAD superfamily hydrolase (TIGR01509 family)
VPDILRNTKAIIFDLDGTLVDSMWIWDTIIEEYLAGFGIPDGPKLKDFISHMHISKVAEYISDHYQLDRSGAQVMDDWNRYITECHKNQVTIIPGAAEFLDRVSDAGIRCCVATESGDDVVEVALEDKGLLGYFEFLICADDVGVGKTSDLIYRTSAERLGATPENTLVFEDALYAVKTAASAGFEVIGVYERLQKHNADEIKRLSKQYILDFTELMD